MQLKTILITGASSGIGSACAEVFASHGARLILCARRQKRLQEIADKLKSQYNTESLCLSMDVCNAEQVQTVLASRPETWRDVDVLINNAGLALGLDTIQEANRDDWEQMIDTNVKGLLYVTHALLPRMIEKQSGHIINLGSIAGRQVYARAAVYCATKHAVKALSEGLRHDLLGTNIRVSNIEPGMVETEFSIVRFHGDADRAERIYQDMTPLSAEDVADAIYFCATRPPHVNISELLIMPTDQASIHSVHRRISQNSEKK